jgi:hypothetical protein
MAWPADPASSVLHRLVRGLGFAVLVAVGWTAPQVNAVESRVSYRLDIAPILSRAGCNTGPCHGNFNGKGGFKLSLRGDDPGDDWLRLTHDTQGRRVDRFHPESSLLLLKPAGLVPHEGGRRFATDSREYRLIREWIAEGAGDDQATVPRVIHLTVEPADQLVVPHADTSGGDAPTEPRYTQRLRVWADLANGSRRDVTADCTYELSDPTRASLAEAGRVTAERSAEVAVAVRFLQNRATSRLAFLAQRPNFNWSGPEPANVIDEHVFARLKALQIEPSPTCSDATYLRRVFLDVIGTLPSPEEVRAFLADTRPDKRARVLDQLLERPEYADFWALKWADVLRNEEKAMGSKGVHSFQRWLRDQIATDTPIDQMAAALITGRGSTWRNPAASFYRTNRDPQACAETVGQVFLGVRIQCARCHNHPFDVWTQDDYYGLAAGFANIQRKEVDNVRRDKFDTHEINGDEIIYLAGRPELKHPRTGSMMAPRPPGEPPLTLGASDADTLDDLADHITHRSRQFARAQANRAWFHLLGRGIVDPIDDFRDSNPPSNPALLEALTDQFLSGQMRLKPLVRLIVGSHTYQLSAATNATNADDATHFSHAVVKLLPAEVLLDAVNLALVGKDESVEEPGPNRAIRMAGIHGDSDGFLKTFGKPDRLLTCECERSDETTLAQAFQLINGRDIRRALESPRNRIGRWLAAHPGDDGLLRELYFASVGREPTPQEQGAALDHVHASNDRRRGWEDIAWALLNSKEFLLRH